MIRRFGLQAVLETPTSAVKEKEDKERADKAAATARRQELVQAAAADPPEPRVWLSGLTRVQELVDPGSTPVEGRPLLNVRR